MMFIKEVRRKMLSLLVGDVPLEKGTFFKVTSPEVDEIRHLKGEVGYVLGYHPEYATPIYAHITGEEGIYYFKEEEITPCKLVEAAP